MRWLRVEGAVRAYRGLTAPALDGEEAEPVELSDVTVPILVVWGEEDRLIAVAELRQFRVRPGAVCATARASQSRGNSAAASR